MLHLMFCIGPTRFVIDARRVSQVVARIPLPALPLSEPYVAGLLDFRGTVLAVVDLATRLFGTACTSSLSTRIIIVRIKHADCGRLSENSRICRSWIQSGICGGWLTLIDGLAQN